MKKQSLEEQRNQLNEKLQLFLKDGRHMDIVQKLMNQIAQIDVMLAAKEEEKEAVSEPNVKEGMRKCTDNSLIKMYAELDGIYNDIGRLAQIGRIDMIGKHKISRLRKLLADCKEREEMNEKIGVDVTTVQPQSIKEIRQLVAEAEANNDDGEGE